MHVSGVSSYSREKNCGMPWHPFLLVMQREWAAWWLIWRMVLNCSQTWEILYQWTSDSDVVGVSVISRSSFLASYSYRRLLNDWDVSQHWHRSAPNPLWSNLYWGSRPWGWNKVWYCCATKEWWVIGWPGRLDHLPLQYQKIFNLFGYELKWPMPLAARLIE